MTVAFNAEIIGELRTRAVAHNEAVTRTEDRVKIGQLKGLYKRYHGGSDPHAHALAKIDEHLARIRDPALLKARRPFDQGRHPRDRRGEFRGGGSRAAASGEHDELLTAAQTQVIPETRYSVFGPPIAGAVGVIGGAAAGATATYKGTASDRLTTRILGHVGERAGGLTGKHVGGTLAVRVPRGVARAGLAQVNRALGTHLPRPGPRAGDAAIAALRAGGAKGGRFVGQKIGEGSGFLFSAPAAFARTQAARYAGGGLRGQIAGRLMGALIGGALLPGGLIYAPALMDAQRKIGPYEDTLFPRRVKKMAGELLDAPEVLAKQAELLADAEVLAKANLGAAARAIARMFARQRRAAGPILGAATTPAAQAAEAVFGAAAHHFNVRSFPRHAIGATGIVAPYAIAGAAGGAGLGALGGAALAHFDEKHPRGAHGRFTRKGHAAVQGSKVGAAIGLGLGLAGGIVAARSGHTGLLTAALARLHGQEKVGDVSLPEAMRYEARRGAQRAHAHVYRAQHARQIPEFAGEGGEPEHIEQTLRANAIDRWMKTEGQAIQGGVKAWYQHHLDRAFDTRVGKELRRLGAVHGFYDETLKSGTTNLVGNVDPERLNEQQRKIWDDAVKRREATLAEIDKIYEQRGQESKDLGAEIRGRQAEKAQLERALRSVPERWDDIHEDAGIAELRNFAKDHLGIELQARAAPAARREIDAYIPTWTVNANERLGRLDAELDTEHGLPAMRAHLRETQQAELLPHEIAAIPNPFRSGKNRFFPSRPPGSNTREGFAKLKEAQGTAAARPFLKASEAQAAEAETHLNSLMEAQEAALEARVPGAGLGQRFFAYAAPRLVPHLRQGAADYAALQTARRARMDGFQKQVSDWLQVHRDPAQALATAKVLSALGIRKGKQVSAAALRNWKTIASIVGAGTAFGVIDINAPWIVQFDRKKWNRPRQLAIVHEYPDVVRRPHEALFGVSYRTREGQAKFLHGVHIRNAAGEHQNIPFGADVEQVRGALRNQQGARGHPEATVTVQNAKQIDDALTELRKNPNAVRKVGPAGFEFETRVGHETDQVRRAQTEFATAIHKQANLDWMQTKPHLNDLSTDKPNLYFEKGLVALFEDPRASVLDMAARAKILVGNHLPPNDPNYRRGIFGSPVIFKAPAAADKSEITNRLIAQLRMRNLEPGNEENYTALRRAMWTLGQYYDLSPNEQSRIVSSMDAHFKRITGREAPTSAESFEATPPSRESEDVVGRLVTNTPQSMRPVGLQDADELHYHLVALYEGYRSSWMREHPNATEGDGHRYAEDRTRSWLRNSGNLLRSDPIAGLAKLAVEGLPRRPRAPVGVSPIPAIAGASQSAGGRPASANVTSATKMPSIAHQVGQSLKPAHALSQIGTYGLGQGAWELANAAAQRFIPGGGLALGALRFATSGGAAIAGSQYGAKAGRAAGRALGDTSKESQQSPGEAIVRGVAGTGAQIGSYYALPALGIGAGAAEGAAEGGAAGSLFGGVGAIPGAIIGTGVGALAGYLTDEGAGILYRNLARYGQHVPKRMGIQPPQSAGTNARAGAVV